ncbi:hypothetical protein JZ751_011306, partial [Albula glossodonta]
MLRAVLQSNKSGVSLSRLQSEYKSLTGEFIPHKQMGYPSMEAFLRSMPSVARMEHSRMGEVSGELGGVPGACWETAHIAQLVARQRTSKKAGRSQLVNCQMRVKPTTPFMLNGGPASGAKFSPVIRMARRKAFVPGGKGPPASSRRSLSHANSSSDTQPIPLTARLKDVRSSKPRTSLRQPDHAGRAGVRGVTHLSSTGRPGSIGDHRQVCMRDTQPEGRVSAPLQIRASNMQIKKPLGPCERPVEPALASVKLKLLKLMKLTPLSLKLHGDLPTMARWPCCSEWEPVWTEAHSWAQPSADSAFRTFANVPPIPPPQNKSDKRMTLPSRFQKEVQAHLSRNSQQSSAPANQNENISLGKPRAPLHSTYNAQVVQNRLKEVLTKYSNGFWVSKLPQLYRELYKQDLPVDALKELEHWSHICTVEKPCSSNPSERLLYPCKAPISSLPPARIKPVAPAHSPALLPTPTFPPPSLKPPAEALAPDVKLKLAELLGKYSSGLWAHALPKLFQEAYKAKLPEHLLANLALLSDICTVEYPMPDNTRKAILYARVPEDELRKRTEARARPRAREEAGRRLSSQAVPPLVIPKEEYPSVLVVEAGSTNSVVLRQGPTHRVPLLLLRYIGEGYSQAQEKLEDEMREFYSQESSGKKALLSPATGQLAAVRAEEEEEVLRAQVCEIMADKVKVIGLEPFCQDPAVLKKFEALACGKILLAEILERDDTPLVVLYDTSHDDDVNINAACLKALQNKALGNPLQVNSTYANVSVTSEFLVSRPFCGKCCLARYKGKWSRVEITNLHGSRVLDIQFVDLGMPASVEVIELREIPPPFLRELIAIPPQAIKCCLADLSMTVGSWTPDAVLWLRDAVLNSTDCTMKIARLDEAKAQVHIHLFSPKCGLDAKRSVNQQMADSDLWKHQTDVFLSSRGPARSTPLATPTTTPPTTTTAAAATKPSPVPQLETGDAKLAPGGPLQLPPLMDLPQVGHNMDIYVSVACHPGHFVLQPWQDLYKLVVLMGEMILYYNKMEERPIRVEKNQIYAAKVENNWHRVLVKGVLTNGLVSVYELDYGKHELVSCTQLQPLINEFRQLPFQGITAQLAGECPPPAPRLCLSSTRTQTPPSPPPTPRLRPPLPPHPDSTFPSTHTQTPPSPPPTPRLHLLLHPHPDSALPTTHSQTPPSPPPTPRLRPPLHPHPDSALPTTHSQTPPSPPPTPTPPSPLPDSTLPSTHTQTPPSRPPTPRLHLPLHPHPDSAFPSTHTQTPSSPPPAPRLHLPLHPHPDSASPRLHRARRVKHKQWSEEASIVFRNHVEKKPLVAQVEAVQEAENAWDRKVVVYLVDTSQEERDIWVHDIMSEFADEQSKA